jgi:nitroreductase
VAHAIRKRRSIRKFTADVISRDVVQEILETARWAPSWGNTQPWELYVLSGKPLEEFRRQNREKMAGGVPFSPDVPMPEIWPEHLKTRYRETGKTLLTAMGIARGDKEGRNKFYADMSDLFNAPCLVIVCISHDAQVEYAMLDVGLIVQTICLAACDKGVGTCIMAAAVGYPDLLKEIASIPQDRRIIMGVALGYPDLSAPVNCFDRQRAEIHELVTWIG